MRIHPVSFAPALLAASFACATAPDDSADRQPKQDVVRVELADPMASFARMVGGEWRVTFTSGAIAFDTWEWGPGRHSVHSGDLEVFYWHPRRKQICILSLHPDIPGVGRGSGEGTIEFDGDRADGVLHLDQPRGRRELGIRWTFDGPDKYHDALLENTGAGFGVLAEWDRVRVPMRSESRPSVATSKPSEHLKMFEPLVGGTWESKGDSRTEHALHARSTFEWLPDYVHARVLTPNENGELAHALDAYFYSDVATGALRCLALSNRGGVYEGEGTVLEGGALQLDLTSSEGDRVIPLVVRFDFEKDGTLRTRAWSAERGERTLALDVRHEKLASPED